MYPTAFPELLLGRLIGRGSYGRVHVGRFRGREVAIKVRARRSASMRQGRSASLRQGRAASLRQGRLAPPAASAHDQAARRLPAACLP